MANKKAAAALARPQRGKNDSCDGILPEPNAASDGALTYDQLVQPGQFAALIDDVHASALPVHAKSVHAALVKFASRTDPTCRAGTRRIAELTGLHPATVGRMIDVLRDAGLIDWPPCSRGGRRVIRFLATTPKCATRAGTPSARAGSAPLPAQREQKVLARVAQDESISNPPQSRRAGGDSARNRLREAGVAAATVRQLVTRYGDDLARRVQLGQAEVDRAARNGGVRDRAAFLVSIISDDERFARLADEAAGRQRAEEHRRAERLATLRERLSCERWVADRAAAWKLTGIGGTPDLDDEVHVEALYQAHLARDVEADKQRARSAQTVESIP